MLVVVVVGSALAIGTVHIPALLVVSAFALIGATLEASSLRRVPWPAVVLAVLGLFSALQAVPLPAAWVSGLSPVSAAVWLRSLVPFGEAALRRFPLSLDEGASVAEALKWLTYACVYIMAIHVRARRGSVWLALVLFGSASLVTLITLAHGVAELTQLYGVYEPNFTVGRWSLGPLLNSNNLAGYAILGLFAGGGLMVSGRSPLPRLPLTIGLGVISAALCLSGSRAGIVSVLAIGVVTLIGLARSQGTRFSLRNLVLGAAPVLIGIAAAVALGTSSEVTQLASLDARRKVSVWLWSLPMIRDHALFGVGRGSFETAFSPYRQALDYDWAIVFTHAENFVVQWIAEWGVPVGLCAVLLIVGYVLREWYGSRSDRLRFLVMAGLVALLVQNLADLGLEVPALAIAAVLALATGERAASSPETESAKPFGRLAFAISAPVLGLWIGTLVWSRFPVELERREMAVAFRALSVKNTDQIARFRAELRGAMRRHPGESYFPLLGSLVAMQTNEDNALIWIGRALELGPTNGPVHLVLARLLHEHGANTQAMLHLRLAAQYDRTLAGLAGAHASLWAPSIDVLLQAIPEGPYGGSMLLEACAKQRSTELKVSCYRRGTLRDPLSSEMQQKLAEALLLAIQAGKSPCNELVVGSCTAEAEAALRTAEKLEPKSWRPPYLMSKVMLARGDAVGAAQILTRVCPPSAEGDQCWQEAIAIAIQSRSESAIARAADVFATRPCDALEACANSLDWLAGKLASGDQPALANTFYTRAAEADPSADRWLKVAEHATQAHLYGVAGAALERADRSPDNSVSSRAHAELLRQAVARGSGSPL
ncbi:MAG: O-antigen ligase family protein [Pseudomonadota bacterium]